jgi:Concanavalin A-like lectin/glucanases superfamily
MKLNSIFLGLLLLAAATALGGQIDFGAYYTQLHTGQEWESYARTGKDADIVVRVAKADGQLVFWRGNSYLPYWKTDKGQWNLEEIIPRSGDGPKFMPDRLNVYSHAEVLENTPASVIVHWRYLAGFSAGNPHGKVNPSNFVDEVFTITPRGRVERVIKTGTDKADDWNDPLNQTIQTLKLSVDGIVETSRKAPKHSGLIAMVKGNPPTRSVVGAPCVWFNFDEGQGDYTTEAITHIKLPVAGSKILWKKGISGTALQFDGYHTAVTLPADKAPALTGGSLTLEGWFALGAYPWNWAPIVQQGDNDGYFIGVDSHGYPGFMVKVDGVWQQLSVPNERPYTDANHLALFRWYHVAGTYNQTDGIMRLYINGKQVADKPIGKGGLQLAKADVRVGKAGILRKPTDGTHDTYPSEFGIDGLIDEVRIHDVALDGGKIAASYANGTRGEAAVAAPDMQKRALPACATNVKFGAQSTRLSYYETWDNLWQVGNHADVVVGFDNFPTKFVFWRGVSYIPMLVNESNQWFTHEFNETGFSADAPGDCEPMSDKACRDSHVRVIENNPARVVIHWRYRLQNPEYHWANVDTNGWGDIADWYYYIYPDGVASKIMRCYSSKPDTWHEWDEQIVILGEGQHPESVVKKVPVMTLVDGAGTATDYDWNPNPPKPDYKGKIIQMIHFTGKFSPFAIQKFDRGDIYSGERTWYSVFPSWNHWPTSQINSSGRNACFPDRAAHSSISHLFWPVSAQQRGKVAYQEKILMEGMTDQPATALVSLAKSWLNAPSVTNVFGGSYQGYEQGRRAYGFGWGSAPLRFQIAASDAKPLHNLCFEIRNWTSRNAKALLKINAISQAPGPDFRQGINIDLDGTCTLIVWVGVSANRTQSFEISEE